MVEEVLPIVPLSRPLFGPTHNTLLLIKSHLTHWKVTIYHFKDKALMSGSTTNSEKGLTLTPVLVYIIIN